MSAYDLQQLSRPDIATRERGHEVADFGGLLASARGHVLHAQHLLHPRPVQMLVERGGAGQRADLEATMPLVKLPFDTLFTRAFPLCAGGHF